MSYVYGKAEEEESYEATFQMQIQLIMPLTLSCAEPDLYHFFFREDYWSPEG